MIPNPPREDPIKRLVEAYTAGPPSISVLRELDRLAWEAFHDPWEDGPRSCIPPSMKQGRLPLEDDAVEAIDSIESLGNPEPAPMMQARAALDLLGCGYVERGGAFVYRHTPGSEDRPLPRFRLYEHDGPQGGLVVEATVILRNGELSLAKALRLCNRFNRSPRRSRVVVIDPPRPEGQLRMVLGCLVEPVQMREAPQLFQVLHETGQDLDWFWELLQAAIRPA